MRTYGVLALATLVQAVGNVCLSKGMKGVSSGSSISAIFSQAALSPTIWIGTALLLLFFLLFATVLSYADLSFVVPALSVEVVVNVAFASYFLNESVSSVRWLGTLLVSFGVILVLRSARQKVRGDPERVEKR